MDRRRDPAILRLKRRRRSMAGVVAGVGLVVATVALSRLEPALPGVSEGTLWIRTVQRGPMLREIRGTGTLVPEEIRWITATSSGRVDRIVLQPGAQVEPGTVILELSNPDLRQQVLGAERDWHTAVAQLTHQKATLVNTRFSQRAAVGDAESAHQLALTDLELNQSLAAGGMVAAFTLKQKQTSAAPSTNACGASSMICASSRRWAACCRW
jgi:HlyD family secretion protein